MPAKLVGGSAMHPADRWNRLLRWVEYKNKDSIRSWTKVQRDEMHYKILERAAIPRAIRTFEVKFGELSPVKRKLLLKNMKRFSMFMGKRRFSTLSQEELGEFQKACHNLNTLLGEKQDDFKLIFLEWMRRA